jgi:hypothetical protein
MTWKIALAFATLGTELVIDSNYTIRLTRFCLIYIFTRCTMGHFTIRLTRFCCFYIFTWYTMGHFTIGLYLHIYRVYKGVGRLHI